MSGGVKRFVIRDELDVLLEKVDDESLRAELRSRIDRLRQRRSYGLVFERHIPERVRLPEHRIGVGSRVVDRGGDDNPTWEVLAIEDGVATLRQVRNAEGEYLERHEHAELERAPLDALVVISEFGEPVLPGFRHLGSIHRGGDKPAHVVIKGENHHVLEALRFTHAGKVDCIYIDPPYNSGARDWKYNNDYVDANDAYRHSKWLAFMERRLKLAKELLNPDDSVLIVAIDEKEYLRLGLLLEQLFPAALIQMVANVIKPGGTSRTEGFSRVAEYLFFVFVGGAEISRTGDNMLFGSHSSRARAALSDSLLWEGMVRRGIGVTRPSRPKQFYPIFIDADSGRIAESGQPLALTESWESVEAPAGLTPVWPIKDDGSEGFWQLSPGGLETARRNGTVRVGSFNDKTGQWRIQYMKAKKAKAVLDGLVKTIGKDSNGVLQLDLTDGELPAESTPRTVWNRSSHDASVGGAGLLNRLVPGRRFPFPKSLYAVEDTVRFVVKARVDAVVLDFFAGSGTTAHAVARLNKQDGGRRQSIMVTNNEVSVEEAAELRKRGIRPGDPEWEALGIFEHITRPRIEAAITGRTPDGDPIRGDYKFTDEFPMADGFEENVEFLELRYLAADDVDLGLAFDDLAALLWLRAGGRGPIARHLDTDGRRLPFSWTEQYGVLFDADRWRAFVSSRPESARAAFIVTYSPAVFVGIAAELPSGMDVVRLYDSYLSRFLPDRAAV